MQIHNHLKIDKRYVIFKHMKNYTIIYSFNGQAKWDAVKANSANEARKKFFKRYSYDNVIVLDIFKL